MCFDTEGDWQATINEWSGVRGSQSKCIECRSEIPDGAWRLHIFQQEHEECQICEYEDGEPCAEGDHDYGESFVGDVCRECCLVRAAINELEEQEGCPSYSREPLFGTLWEELQADKRWGENHYVRFAMQRFPELANHGMCAVLSAKE